MPSTRARPHAMSQMHRSPPAGDATGRIAAMRLLWRGLRTLSRCAVVDPTLRANPEHGTDRPSRRVRGPHWERRYQVSIIAWIVLGAIAGYLAGMFVTGDEGLGVIGHIVLGIVGALVGGFLASVLFNSKPIDGPFDVSSIVVATIGAILTVVVVGMVTGSRRTGRGSV